MNGGGISERVDALHATFRGSYYDGSSCGEGPGDGTRLEGYACWGVCLSDLDVWRDVYDVGVRGFS